MIVNKKIFIFGGTGSLGTALVNRYIKNNIIINYSRDEAKHWAMELKFKSPNLKFIIGDIRDYDRVENAILREKPDIIIIAAALKHIDRCEYAVHECLLTNYMGPQNVINTIEKNITHLTNLETVIFISTDKAANAISAYGASKFMSECKMREASYYLKNIKFCVLRYGNVINSSSSLLPLLHNLVNNPETEYLPLTDPKMTRFLITMDLAIDLLEHAILNGESGDTIIPELISINIKDLFELFSEKYNKPIKITGLRSSERLLETLISATESLSIVKINEYYHIKPHYKHMITQTEPKEYSSNINQLSKEDLKEYLIKLNLF